MTRKRTPWPYQQEAHDRTFDALKDHQSALIVMPTGTGKTVVGSMLAETALKRGIGRTLFLAHREILVRQAESTFAEQGLDVLVEMSKSKAHKQRLIAGDPCVVAATIQTLRERRLQEHWPADYFGLIITDECHHGAAEGHQGIYRHFPEAKHVGITATPDGCRSGMGNIFDVKAFEYPFRRAVQDGYICPPIVRRLPIAVDLRDIKTTGGDFNVGDLAERISPHVEEIADAIADNIGDRYTVVFTPDCGSACAMAQALMSKGVSARYVAGSGGAFGMPKSERAAIMGAFNACEFQVIVCAELLVEGWDAGHVSCSVIAKPTLLRYRFVQMVGRATRTCNALGKDHCLVLDLDWQTESDSRDLCAVIDLYTDEEWEEDVQEKAWFSKLRKMVREIQDKTPEIGQEEILDIIDKGKAFFRDRERFLVHMTGKKARYLGKPIEFTPAGVSKLIGLRLARHDIRTELAGKASEQQLSKLKSLGVLNPDDGVSKWGASKMISRLQRRRSEGLATPHQVSELRRLGMAEDKSLAMSATMAGKTILQLRSNHELFGTL